MIKKLMESYRGKRKNENDNIKKDSKRLKSTILNSTNFNNKIPKGSRVYLKLPYEVLSKVFQQLPYHDLYNCIKTCKRWYGCITNNKSLWRDINLSNCRLYTSNTIQLIAKRSQNMLRSLDLSNCSAISDNALRPLLLYRCNGIESFKLSYNTRVTFNGIINLLKIIGLNLTNLSLSKTQVNDRVIENIFISCPKLQYLDLSECGNLTSDCFKSVYNKKKEISNIKGLRLQNLPSITNKTLNYCAALFPSLELLDILNCNGVSKRGLISIGFFIELKELNITGTSMTIPENVSLEDSFLLLFEKCQKMEKISMKRFVNLSDVTIDIMSGFCSNLREIDIGFAVNITDRSLDLLSNILKYTLTTLNICSCPSITNEGLLYLFNRCEKLANLDISDNPNISDYLFKSFNNPKLPLVNINASNCGNITGNGLNILIEKIIDTIAFINSIHN